MPSNFFAALDDSGDEAPAKAAPAKKKESKVTTPTPVPASKPARRPPHNDRNTKHGRGGRAPARDGKRTYDRKSGTGRGKEIKKGGGGARNWGNDKAEAKKMEGKVDEDAVEKPTDDEAAPAAEEPEVPQPEPEPDNTMTYAEYMASKGKKEEKVREVKDEFAGKTAAVKVSEDFLVMGEGKSKKKKQAKGTKQTVDVGFRVASSNSESDRGGRGGRGRGRGEGRGRGGRGRGRGGGRGGRGEGRGGGRGRGPRINVNDENSFPSL